MGDEDFSDEEFWAALDEENWDIPPQVHAQNITAEPGAISRAQCSTISASGKNGPLQSYLEDVCALASPSTNVEASNQVDASLGYNEKIAPSNAGISRKKVHRGGA